MGLRFAAYGGVYRLLRGPFLQSSESQRPTLATSIPPLNLYPQRRAGDRRLSLRRQAAQGDVRLHRGGVATRWPLKTVLRLWKFESVALPETKICACCGEEFPRPTHTQAGRRALRWPGAWRTQRFCSIACVSEYRLRTRLRWLNGERSGERADEWLPSDLRALEPETPLPLPQDPSPTIPPPPKTPSPSPKTPSDPLPEPHRASLTAFLTSPGVLTPSQRPTEP